MTKSWHTYLEDGHSTDNPGHDHESSTAEEDHQSDLSPQGDIDLPQELLIIAENG